MPLQPKGPTLIPPIKKPSAQVEVIRPFGPTIAKTKIPQSLVDSLNSHCDSWIKDKELRTSLNHGSTLAGNVTEELKISEEFLADGKLVKFLEDSVRYWIESSIGKRIKKFELMSAWIVRQFQHEYNPVHTHSGHISGVGYLKVPNSFGDTYQKNKTSNKNGHIQFIHGNRMFLCNGTKTVLPKVGDFYLFPNYLYHTVYPFISNEERRSFSFNAYIDEGIYNVHGD